MAHPVDTIADALLARATAFVREHRLPGASIGVVHGRDLVWTASLGFADVAAGRAPTPHTLYQVASITKTVTATAVLQLRDAALLHLDDPVVDVLPELRAAASPHGPVESLTLRRLLAHESGLMSEPPGADYTVGRYESNPAATLADAGAIRVAVGTNAQHKYSNLAYQLLGEVVTRVAGVPYTRYVRDRILDPLGLRSSWFAPLPAEAHAARATGYDARWLSDVLTPSAPPVGFEAEGGLASCVVDLARWLAFQTHDAARDSGDEEVLAAATLAEMHRARYLADDAWTEAFGLSWYTVRRDDVGWVQHSGGDIGFVTNICFDPATSVGAIVLLNAPGPASDLSMALAAEARTVVRAAPAMLSAPAPLPPAFAPLLGVYLLAEFGELHRVEWRDGRLTLIERAEHTRHRTLTPTEDADTFVVDPGFRESGEPVHFTRTSDGRVAALTYSGATLPRLDPVRDVS